MDILNCISEDTKINICHPKTIGIAQGNRNKDIYYKRFNFNEFIGEKLANKKKIKTNHYFLTYIDMKLESEIGQFSYSSINKQYIKGGFNLQIGSYNFRENGIEYYSLPNLIDLEKDNIWNLLNCCPLDENKCQLLNEILEMFALDVYMGQKDRNHWNFIFEKYDNNIHLGPLYDYEYSFGRIDDNISYKNPLYNFCCTDDYEILYNIFPQFLDNLKFYEKLDLISIIDEIGTELKLNLKNSDIEYYKSQEELSQKVLQKIINKR